MQAHALADIEVNYEIERIRAWRFRKVSECMRRLNEDALFSANACRERYNALMEGTARIPTEMEDNPDVRRADMEAYRKVREQVRNREKKKEDAKNALESKAKEQVRVLNAQKAEEAAKKRAAKEAEKAQRSMARATQAQIRAQRAADNQSAKTQRNAHIMKKAHVEAKKRSNRHTVQDSATWTHANLKNITAETPDPRGYLSLPDLSKMCLDRGLKVFGKDKDQLVQELRDKDEEWTRHELQVMCRSKGLYTHGTNLQMRHQLALATAQKYASFEAGVAA